MTTHLATTRRTPVPGDVPQLASLTFASDHGKAVVRRRDRGAGLDVAPWVLEVHIGGADRYGFWPDENAATAAAFEVLGHIAEAAAAEEAAVAVVAAADLEARRYRSTVDGAMRAASAVLANDFFGQVDAAA